MYGDSLMQPIMLSKVENRAATIIQKYARRIIKNRAATIIQKYARRIIIYQTLEFPVDLFIDKEWAIGPCSRCGL